MRDEFAHGALCGIYDYVATQISVRELRFPALGHASPDDLALIATSTTRIRSSWPIRRVLMRASCVDVPCWVDVGRRAGAGAEDAEQVESSTIGANRQALG